MKSHGGRLEIVRAKSVVTINNSKNHDEHCMGMVSRNDFEYGMVP